MKNKCAIVSFALLSFALASWNAATLSAQPFTIDWYTIDGGGGYASGGNYQLQGTIGQHDAGPTMTGGSFTVSGGFWNTGGAGLTPIFPDSVDVVLGSLESGQLADVHDSDDSRLCYQRGNPFSPTFPSIWLEFHGVLPTDLPNTLTVVLEAQVDDIGIEQEIQMFNYNTSQFESVHVQDATRNVDSVADVTLTGDLSRFVEQGIGNVRTKVIYTDDGTGFFFGWKACIDQFNWKFN